MDLDKMTFGLELEIGDVDRRLEIPPSLGAWEYSETDVVNLNPPYANVCCDPLGLEPPVGGEVNIFPAHSPEQLADRVDNLIDWFKANNQNPTSNCISHTHVHVRIPGLRDNMTALRSLIRYIILHQDRVAEEIHNFQHLPDMELVKKAKNYLKLDGARRMPIWMAENIINHAENFEDFIRLHAAGKDPKSRGRPFRYMINTYCMKHTDTVEFRFFRHTLERREILSCIKFAQRFMVSAVSGRNGYPQTYDLHFPPFQFDLDQCRGWEKTKYDSTRGTKKRTLHEI